MREVRRATTAAALAVGVVACDPLSVVRQAVLVDESDPEPGAEPPESPGWVPPTAEVGPWRRVGVLSALIWTVVGLAAAYVSAQLGAPRLSGWLAFLTGPIAFWIVGRRHRLAGRDEWARAGCVGLAVAGAIFVVAIVTYTMALYG